DGYLTVTPYITSVGGDVSYAYEDENMLTGNFTSRKNYDFTTKKTFITVKFDIIGSGDAEVFFNIKDLDSSEVLVLQNVPQAAFDEKCSMVGYLSEPAPIPTDKPIGGDEIKVNAKSNLSADQSQVYSTKTEKTVTVTYNLDSTQKFSSGQWKLTYDPAVLKLSDTNYVDGSLNVMPVADAAGGSLANLSSEGLVKGTFSKPSNVYDFSGGKTLVSVTFDIVGKGTTDVTLDVQQLAYIEGDSKIAPMVDSSVKTSAYNATVTSALSEPTPVTVVYGDVDLDGEVTVNDISYLQMSLAKLITLNEQQLLNADTNHDGNVSIDDTSIIQMYLAKLITKI
ncbi:MAG: cohesin domain-containing protein, partial [Ruminococcus sp.]|nr:cohesin domain-containing protein [Ruminococcus sp.]